MAMPVKKKPRSEDLRCFDNPFLKQSSCNDPDRADGKLPTELVSKLQKTISSNVKAIDDAYHKHPVHDHSVYTGNAGIALLHYHLATTLHKDAPLENLQQAERLLRPALQGLDSRRFTFLCGASGPLVMGALIASKLSNYEMEKQCLDALRDLWERTRLQLVKQPSELLYGHVGLLYSLLFVNQTLPGSFEDSVITELVEAVLTSGVGGKEETLPSPMMFTWHHRHYLGAAHGLAGILTLLLQVPVESLKPRIHSLVRPCVDFLLSIRFPSGNLPSSLESSKDDVLVHWCHGAPGAVHLFSQAYKAFGERAYLDAAVLCGEVVWERGLLRKGYGLCHGVAGNAYTFIALYKATGHKHYLERAIKFTEWCLSAQERSCAIPDTPYSLFEGLAGTTLYYCDVLTQLETATFPAFEL